MLHILFDQDWRSGLEDRRACDLESFEYDGRFTTHLVSQSKLHVHVIILLCACLFEVVEVKWTKILGQIVRLSLLFQLRFYFDNIFKMINSSMPLFAKRLLRATCMMLYWHAEVLMLSIWRRFFREIQIKKRFSFLYVDLYVLGDDASISLGSFMWTENLCVLIHVRT